MTSDVRCTGKQGTKKAKGHLLQGLSLGPYLWINANIQEQKPKGVEAVQSLYLAAITAYTFPLLLKLLCTLLHYLQSALPHLN